MVGGTHIFPIKFARLSYPDSFLTPFICFHT